MCARTHGLGAPQPAPCPPQPRLCPQIYQSLLLRGLSLVGWYHSHPHSPALPSLQDIDSQMDYQLRLQGSSNGFQPCLALLCCKSGSPACVRPCVRARGRPGLLTPPGPAPTLTLLLQRLTTPAIRGPSPRSHHSG